MIGLGKMGLPMARHLLGAGYRVVGYDPSTASRDRAAAVGVELVPSPRAAAEITHAALVVVGFDEQAVEVISDPQDGLVAGAASGFVIGMCSTVQASTSVAMAEVAARRGVVVVDTTLCLGEPAAENGDMLIMCGGRGDVLDRLLPVLSVVGKDIFRLGDVGAGQVGKMLNNFLLWNCVVANYEALRLGGRLGLDLESLRQALLLSSGSNWALDTWLRSRPMPWAEKDMRILLACADETLLPMPVAGVIREEITEIKALKNAWKEGEGVKASMDEFTRAHL
ncbi:hypothetical protein A4X20_26405 [Mycolicibacterium iranicum]|uniref:6-phosphogluconate dehydrogenase n=1 Tax=Mycolicibacterium iranicum TaxID=912594 RepID=A0A178LQM1_MYCIR|nr:hypothetical protein A4X20_26405 [Mycolicibacterium iranicum]